MVRLVMAPPNEFSELTPTSKETPTVLLAVAAVLSQAVLLDASVKLCVNLVRANTEGHMHWSQPV